MTTSNAGIIFRLATAFLGEDHFAVNGGVLLQNTPAKIRQGVMKETGDSFFKAKFSLNWTARYKVISARPCYSCDVPDKKSLASKILFAEPPSGMPVFDDKRRVCLLLDASQPQTRMLPMVHRNASPLAWRNAFQTTTHRSLYPVNSRTRSYAWLWRSAAESPWARISWTRLWLPSICERPKLWVVVAVADQYDIYAKPVAALTELLQANWACSRYSPQSFYLSLTTIEMICAMVWFTRSTAPLPSGCFELVAVLLNPIGLYTARESLKHNSTPSSDRNYTGYPHTGMNLLANNIAGPLAVKFGPEITAYMTAWRLKKSMLASVGFSMSCWRRHHFIELGCRTARYLILQVLKLD